MCLKLTSDDMQIDRRHIVAHLFSSTESPHHLEDTWSLEETGLKEEHDLS